MDQKIQNIMNYLANDFETASKKVGENVFEIDAKLPAHKAFLKLETATDVLRAELQYMFGCLNFDKGIGGQELLKMLTANVGSFGFTSSYLGVKEIEGTFYTVLSGYYLFHTKWADRDIADILSLALSDIHVNFMSWDWDDSIHVFSQQDIGQG